MGLESYHRGQPHLGLAHPLEVLATTGGCDAQHG